jgi:polysaccharide pyruvyl transferase WcaK-like protein
MKNGQQNKVDRLLRQTAIDSLDSSIEHLDAGTLSHLNQARHKALSHARRQRLLDSQWLKAGAFALLLVTIFNGWLFMSDTGMEQMNTDDFELIVANEDYELIQELDFVTWMIEEENAS